MVVPSTDYGFSDSGSAQRSLDGKDGMSFDTFDLPDDGCVRLVVKNMSRAMHQSFDREELESLKIRA